MPIPVPKPPKREKKPKRPIARQAPIARTSRPKPISKKTRARLPERATCRRIVIERDTGRCRSCGAWVGSAGHVHEIKFRSQGGSPYDPTNAVLLCAQCHSQIHARLITVIVMSAEGADGLVLFSRVTKVRGSTHDEAESEDG